MEKIKKNKKIYIAICAFVICICVIICIIIDKQNNNEEVHIESNLQELSNVQIENTSQNNTKEINKNIEKIIVHVSGEVNAPNIYELKKESRIADAIEIAGGLTERADISKVNLAYTLSDGEKITIPAEGEQKINEEDIVSRQSDGSAGNEWNSPKRKDKININIATQTELECLTGVGPSLASKIIEYRKNNGKFRKIEDLKNVSGIGEAKFNGLKDEIEV